MTIVQVIDENYKINDLKNNLIVNKSESSLDKNVTLFKAYLITTLHQSVCMQAGVRNANTSGNTE